MGSAAVVVTKEEWVAAELRPGRRGAFLGFSNTWSLCWTTSSRTFGWFTSARLALSNALGNTQQGNSRALFLVGYLLPPPHTAPAVAVVRSRRLPTASSTWALTARCGRTGPSLRVPCPSASSALRKRTWSLCSSARGSEGKTTFPRHARAGSGTTKAFSPAAPSPTLGPPGPPSAPSATRNPLPLPWLLEAQQLPCPAPWQPPMGVSTTTVYSSFTCRLIFPNLNLELASRNMVVGMIQRRSSTSFRRGTNLVKKH
mmetsp:Transcript_12569/g.21255  ORF Transcript_12569/g.21255 Transcript_12569/m.21255 type:complete len:257 (+) Transcript_12569:320-1090(+)